MRRRKLLSQVSRWTSFRGCRRWVTEPPSRQTSARGRRAPTSSAMSTSSCPASGSFARASPGLSRIMRRLHFRSRKRPLVLCASLACATFSGRAHGQACCAGTGAVTPGRLALHEVALVGTQWKAGDVLGSFDAGSHYTPSPSGASELDLEQDIFGAMRVLGRGQMALLVPFVETRRTSQGLAEFGGNIGDVNASVRYDFTLAGASTVLPGIAALAGLTLPTGTPPDSPRLEPLATGATGIGAYQINAGAAFEQAFGPWLLNATGIVAQRTARTVGSTPNQVHERLGSQWTLLVAVAYTFPSEVAIAASASYLV